MAHELAPPIFGAPFRFCASYAQGAGYMHPSTRHPDRCTVLGPELSRLRDTVTELLAEPRLYRLVRIATRSVPSRRDVPRRSVPGRRRVALVLVLHRREPAVDLRAGLLTLEPVALLQDS